MIYFLLIVVLLFLFWRYLYFFRNPNRKIPVNPEHVLSPADGYVVYIKEINAEEPAFAVKKNKPIKLWELFQVAKEERIGKKGYLIGIYMSTIDVHYNRMPIAGFIRKLMHDFPQSSQGNLSMLNVFDNLIFNRKPLYDGAEYLISNERASYLISNETISLYVTQIADRWIKKIATYKDQEKAEQGEVFGLIRMGSQVDLFIPFKEGFEIEPMVAPRQHLKAGLTPIFHLRKSDSNDQF
ncbi:MAG: phosphatidylserine decarboxylase [Bacteroidota bacterium]